MKKVLSLAILTMSVAVIFGGCSGTSDEEAKKVDLNAKPVNPPTATGPGGQEQPGPGAEKKEAN